MQVVCHSDSIVLVVNTNAPFNGMLYAKDSANNPECLSEFHASTNMSLRLPLRACGTLSAEVDDGIEFFNTIVVQPHMRLMTNQGKGYHIRCKYQTRERTIANSHFNVSAAFHTQNGPQTSTMPLLATASMPMCTMKIYRIDQDNVAESVKVGDKLVMVIEIDRQDMYGMRVTNCVVRDGLNKAEQQLINDSGCPVDESIMPKFEYENNNTRAAVAFRAHKFPHTSSIYYQCNVRLCINGGAGGCEQVSCPARPADGLTAGTQPAGGVPNVTNELTAGSGFNLGAGSGLGSGPRLKRFIGHHHANNSSSQASKSDTAAAQLDGASATAETELAELPKPVELRAESKAQQRAQSEMSFDVYSGLYVSDSDMSASNSDDPNGQQVLPARRDQTGANGGGSEPAESCLTVGRASLLVVFASLGSVALVVLIAFQAGLIPAGDEHDEHDDGQRGSPPRRRHHHGAPRAARRHDPLDGHNQQQQQQMHSAGQSAAGRYHGAANFNMRPALGSAKCLSSFYQFA
jgi:hypothetical protein